VLQIDELSGVLRPQDSQARTGTVQWAFAAPKAIEPFVQNLAFIDLCYADEEWAKLQRPGARQVMERRLDAQTSRLADQPYLE
jgi:glutathione S-transferase